MNLKQLKVSRALWKRREDYRLRQLRKYKANGDMTLQSKWRRLWNEARRTRKLRDSEIASKENASMTSSKGLAFITREEGSIPYAYNDPKNYATFGVGHLLHYSPITAADQAKWGTPSRPRRDLVQPTLKRDIQRFEKVVRGAVKVPLKQHQFDACVSLAFNIGTGGFATSSVVKRLNAREFGAAANAFLLWDNPSMLRPRRERERKLFLTGKYS